MYRRHVHRQDTSAGPWKRLERAGGKCNEKNVCTGRARRAEDWEEFDFRARESSERERVRESEFRRAIYKKKAEIFDIAPEPEG